MRIRSFSRDDMLQLREVHHKYFSADFDFPDFYRNFLCAYTVSSDDGKLIASGGVRTLCEAVIITDQEEYARTRVKAIDMMLQFGSVVATKNGYNEIHAFIHGNTWKKQLEKFGFEPINGEGLVLGLE